MQSPGITLPGSLQRRRAENGQGTQIKGIWEMDARKRKAAAAAAALSSPAPALGPRASESDVAIDEAAKYKKQYEDTKAAHDELYDRLVLKDKYIENLEKEREDFRTNATAAKRNQDGIAHENEQLLQDAIQRREELENLQERYSQVAEELRTSKTKASEFERFFRNTQSEFHEERNKYLDLRNQHDKAQADVVAAHQDIDRHQAELDELRDINRENEEARQYMSTVNESLQDIFLEQGKDLNPQSLAEHLQRSIDDVNLQPSGSPVDDDAQVKRPKPNLRKASLHDELAASELQGEDSDPETSGDTLHVPKRANESAKLNALEEEVSAKVKEIKDQRERMKRQEESLFLQQKRINELEKAAEATERAEFDNKMFRKAITTAASKKDTSSTFDSDEPLRLPGLERAKYQSLLESSARQSEENETHRQHIKTQAESISQQRQRITGLERVITKRNAHTTTNTTTRYVTRVEMATVFEAIQNASWVTHLLLTLLVLSCAGMFVSGQHERSLWLGANAPAATAVRSSLAPLASVSEWQAWFEGLAGFDGTLLG